MFKLAEQPQSIGQVLDSGFKLYRSSFKSILPLAALSGIATSAPTVIQALSSNPDLPADDGMGLIASIAFIVFMLFSFLVMVALVDGMKRFMETGSIALGAAFQVGLKRFLPVVFAMFLYGIACMVGIVLLIVPGVIISLSASLFIYAMVFDGLGPIASLKRSHKLVWGHWWRTATVITVPVIIYIVLFLGAGIVLGVAGVMGMVDMDGTLALLFQAAFQAVVTTLISPVLYAIGIVQFSDLKLRKDGGDLAARMQQE